MKFSAISTDKYPTVVRHQGMSIVLALRREEEDKVCNIYYRVLATDPAQPDDDKCWSDRKKLSFPDQIRPAGMSLVTVGLKTAERTADAPFQALSDGKHVYLFRQSTGGTLYVDRFVFDPVEKSLNPNWEPRYQRSQKRDIPASRKDSLGARNMEGEPFIEPTMELSMIQNLEDGRFSVLLLPGRLPSEWRWQIFVTNPKGEIDSFSIRRSEDGLFDVKEKEVQQTCFKWAASERRFLTGPTALLYMQQEEAQDEYGRTQRLKRGARVMLAAPVGSARYALELDGVNDYVEIPSNSGLDLGANFTIEAWIKPAAGYGVPRDGCIALVNRRGPDESSPPAYLLGLNGQGNLLFWTYDGSKLSQLTSKATVPVDRWTHIAGVLENGTLKVYLNGRLDNSAESKAVTPQSGGGTLSIGADPVSGNYFKGQLNQVCLWNLSRDQADIEQTMYQPLAGDELGLMGYWPFDEGMGDAVHDQAGDHHGQLYVGSALEFDGVDDYVNIPALDLREFTTMTIEAWIKPGDISTNQYYEIIRQDYFGSDPDWLLAFQEHGQILSFGLFTGVFYQELDVPIRPTEYTDGQWHHIAATYDGQTQRLYRDGREIGSKSKTGRIIRFSANAVHSIGSCDGKVNFFKGQIGHVRFWKVARTKEEIQDSYDRLTGDQSDLLSYWPLDEGAGVTIHDQAGDHHGQLNVGYGNALDFDGLDDWVSIPAINLNAYNTMSIEAWVKPGDISTNPYYEIIRQEGVEWPDWLLAFQEHGQILSFGLFTGDSYQELDVSIRPTDYTDGQWHHIAATYDGDTQCLYRDGDEIGSQSKTGSIRFSADADHSIGSCAGTSEFFKGQIGQVCLWNVARTPEDIQQDKSNYLTGDESGLAACWPLDEGTGDRIQDLASGNHGQFYIGSGDNLERKWVKGPLPVDVGTKWVACDNPHEKWVALAPIAVLDYGLSRQGTLAMLPDRSVVSLGLRGDGGPVDLSIPRFQAEADQLPMGVVRRDKQGLSVCAGLLELAPTGDTPYLLDGADGLIHLYFRGDHGQFLVAQYDTLTARAEYALPLGAGDGGPQLRFIAHQPGSHMNNYTIKIEEATGQTCRVTLNGPDGVNETWQNVPRQLEQFLAVLNGTATTDANDPLVEKRKLVFYDYKNKQNVQREGVPDLASGDIPFFGSTLFGVGADNLPEPGQALQVQSGKVTQAHPAGKDCAWVPEPPGHALEFDGEDDYVDVALPPHRLDIPGDLTMEAWVKVDPGDHNDMRLVNYHTQELRFTLGLNRAEKGEGYQVVAGNGDKAIRAVGALVPPDEWTHLAAVYDATTALKLDGQGYVDCGNDVTLDMGEAMTVEAWVTPAMPTGQRQPEVILSKWGSDPAKQQSWRLYIDPDGKPCFETKNRHNKLTSVTADLRLEAGQAYHLAGIFDPASKEEEVALQFNGTDSVSLGNLNGLQINEEIALEAWVKVQATDSVQNIIARGTDGVYLRIKEGQYQVGAGKQCASAEIPEEDKAAWVHLAGVYDRQEKAWILYRNGIEVSRTQESIGAIQVTAGWAIGATGTGTERFFKGQLNNVRLWDRALSRREIVENMDKEAKDIEGAAGNWAFDTQDKLQAKTQKKTVKDHSNNGNDGELSGNLTEQSYVDIDKGSNAQKIVVYPAEQEVKVTLGFDGVDDYVELPEMNPDYAKGFTVEAWVRYHSFQKWSRIIDFGNGEAKDNILLANAGETDNLEFHVYQGKAGTVSAPGVLVANTWMHLAATVDGDGNADLYINGESKAHEIINKPNSLPRKKNYIGRSNWAGDSYFDGDIREVRIWNVARSKDQIKANKDKSLSGDEPGLVGYWPLDEASLQTGQVRDHSRYGYNGVLHGGTLVWSAGDKAKSETLDHDRALLSTKTRVNIGRSASDEHYFRGTLDEVRLWQVGRGEGQLHFYRDHWPGNAEGLVSDWRFEEGRGKTARDVKGSNHGRLVHPEAEQIPTMWISSALNARLILYVNGQVAADQEIKLEDHGHYGLNNQFTIGAMLDKDETVEPQADKPLQNMAGCIDEVRLWNTVRTPEQLRDNMYRALFGGEEGLVGYWTLDAGAGTTIADLSGNNQTGTLHGPQWIDSSAPIGNEGPEVKNVYGGQPKPGFNRRIVGPPAAVEYGDMQWDAEGNLFGVMKRGYIFQEEAIQLVTGFKVGDLELHFISQVQTAPTLIGYIEGAPPVPSENLTVNDPEEDDYVGTSSIQLTEAKETIQVYSASRDWGSDTLKDFKGGLYWVANFTMGGSTGIGQQVSWETQVFYTEGKVGYHRNLEESRGTLSSASLTAGTSKTLTKSLVLCGGWEEMQDYDQTGQARYLNPEVGQRYLPNNMGYALVKSATADLFAMRLKSTGSLVAFQVVPNPDIPEDWNIIMFPLNPKYVKSGTLDGMVGLVPDPDYPGAIAGERGSYFKPLEAYALKERIEREAKKIESYYANFEAEAKGQSPDTGAGPEELWGELPREEELGYDWQTGRDRRSTVNTYVWTADGGFYAEEEQFSSIRQESLGGSYHSLEREGVFADISLFSAYLPFFFECDALWGSHLNVTVSKSQEEKAAFGLQVEVQGEGYLFEKGEWNEKTQKFNYTSHACPGKVDGYRFMTFYLQPKPDNFDRFFDPSPEKGVVDQDWLYEQGDYAGKYNPNARALREARSRPNEVWRVLHRVTYVSRIPPQSERTPVEVVPKDVRRPDNIEANGGLIQEIKWLVPPQPSLIELGVAVDKLLGQPLVSGDDGWSPGELEGIIPWWTKVKSEAKKEIRRDVIEYLKGYYEIELTPPEIEQDKQRVTAGLQVLYTFEEGKGKTVHDSGVGKPLNLKVEEGAVKWIPGGLRIREKTLVATPERKPATKIIAACKDSNELSIEAWVKPANATQSGPARIVTLSLNPSNRNFTLAQDHKHYQIRLRTTKKDKNGTHYALEAGEVATDDLSHLVYTRDASGTARFYVNGDQVGYGQVPGDFDHWDDGYRFGLGNEVEGTEPDKPRFWQGELHLVAIYSRALKPDEVSQNFEAGLD
jgi:hypothetical protein